MDSDERRLLDACYLQQNTPNQTHDDVVDTPHGSLYVDVQGDRSMNAIFTYHDIGLNSHTCFEQFFKQSQMKEILSNFCVYNINAIGHETGAVLNCMNEDYSYPSLDDLAWMLLDVMRKYELTHFIGIGVGAGANVLSRFALHEPDRVDALILVNADAGVAGWKEFVQQKTLIWFHKNGQLSTRCNKYLIWYHLGNKSFNNNVRLRERYNKKICCVNPVYLSHFWNAYINRTNIGIVRELDEVKRKNVRNFKCRVMVMSGEGAAHFDETVLMNGRMHPSNSDIIRLPCGGAIFDEETDRCSEAILLFLQGLGYVGQLRIKEHGTVHY